MIKRIGKLLVAFLVAGSFLAQARTRPHSINEFKVGYLNDFDQKTITAYMLPHCSGIGDVVSCSGGGEYDEDIRRPTYHVNTPDGKWTLSPPLRHDELSKLVAFSDGKVLADTEPPNECKFLYRIFEDGRGRKHFMVAYDLKHGKWFEAEYRIRDHK